MTIASQTALFQHWLPQLSDKTGLDRSSLLTTGLPLEAYGSKTVTISFEDGSSVRFLNAFYLINWAQESLVGVFTKDCGSHEFNVSSTTVLNEVSAKLVP